MKVIQYINNSRKGSALIMVIIALVIMSIMITSVVFLTQTNTLQVSNQEKGVQAYYIARSGAELTYQILLTSGPTSLLEPFSSLTYTLPNPTFPNGSIDFGEGTATVTVTAFDQGAPAVRRIRITSVGEADGSDIQRTAILEFDRGDGGAIAAGGNVTWSR